MKSDKEKNIDVVHLIWVPYGISLFERFLKSYQANKAGSPHNLVLLFNGVSDENEIQPYLFHANEMNVEYKVLIYDGACQDIDAYRWAATKLTNEYLFILNSYSQLLYPNWLAFYFKQITEPAIALVGATASYQSYLSSVFQKNKWAWETNKSFKQNFDKYKLLLKAGTLWRFYFKPFSNPHIRTNAFMVKRELFLSLHFPVIKAKLDAYRFESGRNGFSAQLLKRGHIILLIDKFGKTYPIKEWASTNIFWQGLQEDLLVSDNQTETYIDATDKEKSLLSFLAWGNK